MKAIKLLWVSLIFLNFSFASNKLEDLYKQADVYEKNNDYKKALEIYKQIAKEEKNASRTYFDEEKIITDDVVTQTLDEIDDKETEQTIYQIITNAFNLYPYEENYFFPFSYDTKKRANREQIETKFQISVKKPIFTNFFNMNETINFGYTQTSWWQLYSDSSPFRETNYRPEIFVTVPYGKKDKTSLKGFKFGFLHESNGQPEGNSRSWNRLYLTSYFQAGNLFITPRVWYRIPERESEDDNPDIEKYLGYGDLTFSYAYKTHTFKLLLRNNLRFNSQNKGFAQLDWTFPFFGSKNTFGYIQASTGYGDSLIDYNEEVNRISFGVSLSR